MSDVSAQTDCVSERTDLFGVASGTGKSSLCSLLAMDTEKTIRESFLLMEKMSESLRSSRWVNIRKN